MTTEYDPLPFEPKLTPAEDPTPQVQQVVDRLRHGEGLEDLWLCLLGEGERAPVRMGAPPPEGRPCASCEPSPRCSAATAPCAGGPVCRIRYTGSVGGFVGGRSVPEQLRRALARRVGRYLVQWRFHSRNPASLIAPVQGRFTRDLATFFDRTCRSALPVLVVGEPGSGREDVAQGVHHMDSTRTGLLRVLDCARPTEDLRLQFGDQCHSAQKGTLLLATVDRLSQEAQGALARYIHAELDCLSISRPGARGPRLVATASAREALHPRLRRELDFLTFELESLCGGSEEIRRLANHYANLFGSPTDLSPRVLAVLESYGWPGNRAELRQVVARLVAFGRNGEVRVEDLRRVASEVVDASAVEEPERLAELVAGGGPLPLSGIPQAVQRALWYIAEAYDQDLSLAAIGRHCCVSSSHLSQLFRRALSVSPIAFLIRVRIEVAKKLLIDQPEVSITSIAFDSGFNDLRHFQRTFKQQVGRTPSAFREDGKGPIQHSGGRSSARNATSAV